MRSIKEPIEEIDEVRQNLSAAVTAFLCGRSHEAETHFRAADCPKVWAWVNPDWSRADLNVRIKNPPGDTTQVSRALRDPDRSIAKAVRAEVLARDGHRCRYCGIPVVSADIRKLAHRLYPEAVRWGGVDPTTQHAGFQCLWLQYDHVVPHSHGGRSTAENVVISCALCNFGKDRYTLLQLGVEDPRLRSPERTDWDGLESFRDPAKATLRASGVIEENASRRAILKAKSEASVPAESKQNVAYFLPNAWISNGYVLTPEIEGKERWFQIGSEIFAEPVERVGVPGVRLVCAPRLLRRRGIEPDSLTDMSALLPSAFTDDENASSIKKG